MKKIIIICAFALTVSITYAQQYGWSVIAQPRPGYQMYAVEFKDSLQGWCEAGGAIYWTKDGGHTWNANGPSMAGRITDISFADTLNGWAVGSIFGDEAIVWKTTDAGLNWIEQRHDNKRDYNGVAAQSKNKSTISGSTHMSIVRDTGKIWQTFNGGQLWVEQTHADSINALGPIQFVDSLHGWIISAYNSTVGGVGHNGLLHTVDGGTTWQLINQVVGSFSFVDTLNGFAYGGRNYGTENIGFLIFRTRNGGLTWDSTFVLDATVGGDGIYIKAVSFIDTLSGWLFGETYYQGGSSEIIIRTTDGGKNWTRESVGLTDYINDAMMIDAYHGWAVTIDGQVMGYGLVSAVPEHLPQLPSGYILRQNYPNPFNNSTVIEYEIPHESDVKLTVFDPLGRLITTLIDQHETPGLYRVRFDAQFLSSGIYYYEMKTKKYHTAKQLILLK